MKVLFKDGPDLLVDYVRQFLDDSLSGMRGAAKLAVELLEAMSSSSSSTVYGHFTHFEVILWTSRPEHGRPNNPQVWIRFCAPARHDPGAFSDEAAFEITYRLPKLERPFFSKTAHAATPDAAAQIVEQVIRCCDEPLSAAGAGG